ncbi:cupredoxin domain-containing protein [Candidatus Binatus sp.]|uniref:cupredoxin domain-containing protein n=1 Tax=Candidatus Binatus sp. TaxID=2811406 RepID=UPI002F938B45
MSTLFKFLIAGLFVLAAAATAPAAAGAQEGVAEIRFDNHHFAPQTLTVPAGQPLMIKVVNSSKETIEFESFQLNREVAMTPGETITVHLPALSPGSYDFYDDFHQDVRQGSLIAK